MLRTAFPATEKGSPQTGPALLTDVSLPAAVIDTAALDHNIHWMQDFARERHALLAPHGKTSMTPAIFRRQLEAGAWGITLATATQCAAAFAHGVKRLLMANQLVGAPDMHIVAGLLRAGADLHAVVDSLANVEALDAYFGQHDLRLKVLIEIGVPGGRCGVRTQEQCDTLATAIARAGHLQLCGIEGYEGMIGGEHPEAAVRAYGERLVRAVQGLRASGAIQGPALLTASGSRWFDLIAEAFRQAGSEGHVTPLLRPGCYVVHDHRLYRDAMAEVKARQPGLAGELRAALSVYARVQSLPEPGLAVVAMGKRDISADPDLPMPLTLHHDGQSHPAEGLATRKIMDQHTLLDVAPGTHLAIGDVIAFGASHPCLTFDKWRQILLVDERLNVLERMPTCF